MLPACACTLLGKLSFIYYLRIVCFTLLFLLQTDSGYLRSGPMKVVRKQLKVSWLCWFLSKFSQLFILLILPKLVVSALSSISQPFSYKMNLITYDMNLQPQCDICHHTTLLVTNSSSWCQCKLALSLIWYHLICDSVIFSICKQGKEGDCCSDFKY